jgi:hypothetical protein
MEQLVRLVQCRKGGARNGLIRAQNLITKNHINCLKIAITQFRVALKQDYLRIKRKP